MTDILGLIDNAIEDYQTSGDAMRWTPERPPERQRHTPASIAAEAGALYRMLCEITDTPTVVRIALHTSHPPEDHEPEVLYNWAGGGLYPRQHAESLHSDHLHITMHRRRRGANPTACWLDEVYLKVPDRREAARSMHMAYSRRLRSRRRRR